MQIRQERGGRIGGGDRVLKKYQKDEVQVFGTLEGKGKPRSAIMARQARNLGLERLEKGVRKENK